MMNPDFTAVQFTQNHLRQAKKMRRIKTALLLCQIGWGLILGLHLLQILPLTQAHTWLVIGIWLLVSLLSWLPAQSRDMPSYLEKCSFYTLKRTLRPDEVAWRLELAQALEEDFHRIIQLKYGESEPIGSDHSISLHIKSQYVHFHEMKSAKIDWKQDLPTFNLILEKAPKWFDRALPICHTVTLERLSAHDRLKLTRLHHQKSESARARSLQS